MIYVLGVQLLEDGIRIEKLRTRERLHAVSQLLDGGTCLGALGRVNCVHLFLVGGLHLRQSGYFNFFG